MVRAKDLSKDMPDILWFLLLVIFEKFLVLQTLSDVNCCINKIAVHYVKLMAVLSSSFVVVDHSYFPFFR